MGVIMLENLQIKNAALIDEAELEFSQGLNILTGETGAGKSILIDSINFLLGERAGKDFIRSGRNEAQVSGIIYVGHEQTAEAMASMGVEVDDDGRLLLWRSIASTGKGSCRINGRAVTLSLLREISGMLVDVHGQHQHQSLLDQQKHMGLLDRFCGDELEKEKEKLREAVGQYRSILKSIQKISSDEKDRNARMEMLLFQTGEIEEVKLRPNEEEHLIKRKSFLSGMESLKENTVEALTRLRGRQGEEDGALELISRAADNLTALAEVDKDKEALRSELAEIETRLEEVVRELDHYSDGFDYDPEELNNIEERLDAIERLKRKYGGTVGSVLAHYESCMAQLENISNSQDKLKDLASEKKKFGQAIASLCEKISEIRKSAGVRIQRQIEEALRDLGMKSVRFEILIERKKEFNENGFDRVEFLISPNPGEPLRPLAKIASGGEMSRVMLALKTVLAEADQIETFIFDEIDTGVSGRTAQQVAEKLAFLGRSHQILCITHLPQIASMSDRHFLIEKKTEEEHTFTTVKELDQENSAMELSRLIGGAKITDATRKAASEMKQMAMQLKEKIRGKA